MRIRTHEILSAARILYLRSKTLCVLAHLIVFRLASCKAAGERAAYLINSPRIYEISKLYINAGAMVRP